MSFHATHYRTGEEIRPGDRITWAGVPGCVVLVLNSPGVPDDWADTEDWLGEKDAEGHMLDIENGVGWVFQYESDEDLVWLGRESGMAAGTSGRCGQLHPMTRSHANEAGTLPTQFASADDCDSSSRDNSRRSGMVHQDVPAFQILSQEGKLLRATV